MVYSSRRALLAKERPDIGHVLERDFFDVPLATRVWTETNCMERRLGLEFSTSKLTSSSLFCVEQSELERGDN